MLSRSATLAAISGTALDAVVAADRRARIVGWNKVAEKIFGWREDEVLDRTIHEIIVPEEERARCSAAIERFNQSGTIRLLGKRLELEAMHREGALIPVELSLMMAPNSGGDIFIAFLRDLTREKEAERRIAELQSEVVHLSRVNAMGTMASVLAHELNQPLTAAASYLSTARRLLGREPLDDGIDANYVIERAERAVHRAGDTIRSIRRMVSKQPSQNEELAIDDLVAETLRLLGTAIPVRPGLDFAPDAERVLANRVQIEQVLLNLLKNASEAVATTSEPALAISARRAGSEVVICVADNGPGVPSHVAETLFSPVDSEKGSGMGIGLSVCRTIVEQHGGKIWLDQEEGATRFCFTVAAPDA